MSLSLMTLPLMLCLSAEDWLRDDRFPYDPLVGKFRVVEVYPRPLRLRHPTTDIAQGLGDPLLHLHQLISIEHVGEAVYFSQPAQEYRFTFHGLPPDAAVDNAGLPPPIWQDNPQSTHNITGAVIGFEGTADAYAAFGALPEALNYIVAFGQPGPEANLFVTNEGDLIWSISVRVVPEVQRHTTSLTIAFRLKREG